MADNIRKRFAIGQIWLITYVTLTILSLKKKSGNPGLHVKCFKMLPTNKRMNSVSMEFSCGCATVVWIWGFSGRRRQ